MWHWWVGESGSSYTVILSHVLIFHINHALHFGPTTGDFKNLEFYIWFAFEDWKKQAVFSLLTYCCLQGGL